MLVMISPKWLDFTGTGEAGSSIAGSCLYGGAGEHGIIGVHRPPLNLGPPLIPKLQVHP